MGEARKIETEVSGALADDINSAISVGDYIDAEAVLKDALAVWQVHRQTYIQRLRELWDEGINSGEPKPFTDDVWKGIIERGNARIAALHAKRDAA